MFLFISTNGGPATSLSVALFVCTCVDSPLREAVSRFAPIVVAVVGLLLQATGSAASAA